MDLTNFGLILMGSPSGGEGGGSFLPTMIMFGAIILIMYFLMIRPQQKRQKEHQAMLDSLRKGDNVVTQGGMHGKITDIDGNVFIIQVAENVKIEFDKSSIIRKK